MYSVEGLEEGIKNSRKNINVLETAIEGELQTIKNYRVMINDLEEAARLMAEAEANTHVEVVRE